MEWDQIGLKEAINGNQINWFRIWQGITQFPWESTEKCYGIVATLMW